MKKTIILFFVLALLCGCESKLDKAIPPSFLVGAVSNIDINLNGEGELADRQNCANRNGWCWKPEDWIMLKADGFVPPDIKREQIKPTILAILKRLIKEYPKCKKIFINLAPDKEMVGLGYLVSRGEYENNKIKILYGIPSDKEIEEYNSKIGKFYPSSKDCGKIFCEPDYTKMKKNDAPRLFRPDQKTYMKYKPIFKAYEDFIYYKSKDKLHYSTSECYVEVSKKTGYSVKDIKEASEFMHSYYSLWACGRDDEIINIPLK
ncbi:MAG: hypothetical protein CVU55_12205 [Deltaproteobacteria bacterium HGW-Deltaproteobacteria-13]|jgi:hypothetical protein|nr:MAG: hypothetical protein CVU55_12205 [Deltaproteobacteria bacterium HGW-Deltaproteobacteria-13]